ncbi:MAG TPA: polyphenol oxidase family protein [Marmoricola sp.]|nr:polyphenol oxidase family protein [Marmoricola sp.]
MYAFRASHGPVDLAFTDRLGGVSGVPYAELNLALDDADDPAARAENLRRVVTDFAPDLAADLRSHVVQVRQVHGAAVDLVDDRSAGDALPEADGMVATDPGAILVVRTADCLPVLLADPGTGVIAAAHAGRPGMVAGVVPATVARMRELGAHHITAWLGPHICGACYEVPAQMQAEVVDRVPASRATTSWGTPSVDIGAGVRAQLEALDVEVLEVGGCTRESTDLYSYRRDGAQAGRLAGLIRRRT